MNYTIFFTNQCNMRCAYCYEQNKINCSISYSVLDGIIKYIAQRYSAEYDNKISVVIHGGEPLLEFEKIKYFIRKLNLKISDVKYIITTNATLLTDSIADFLLSNFAEISISIDGNVKSHDSNRVFINGKGTYDIVARNAMKILARDKSVKARMTINEQTVDNLFENVTHLIRMGFRTIIPVADSFCKNWTNESMNKLVEQGKLITDYVLNFPEPVNVGLINDALSRQKNTPCNGGTSTLSIDTDGTMYPCVISVGIPEFAIGDISTGLNKLKIQKIVEWNNVDIPECAGCSRYDYCNSTRCRIINKVMCGDLHTPSPTVCSIENAKVTLSQYYMRVFPACRRL